MATKDKLVTVEALGALKDYADGELSGKADSSHTHDSRYYTETETDTLLGAKAEITDIQAGTQATRDYHLGFYIDGEGYLCQYDS